MNYDDLKDFAEESLKLDWMSFVDFVAVVQQSSPDLKGDAGIRHAAVSVARLVLDGLILPGDVGEGGFEPWPTTREESAARIEAEVDDAVATDADLDTGDIAWFTDPADFPR